MTLESEIYREQYVTNGTTGPWTVPFYFLSNDDIKVLFTDEAGNELTLAAPDYSVTGAGDPAGGTITTTTAYPATTPASYITILRNMRLLQETDYTETDAFPAESHEQALDRLTMMVQQIAELVGRALVFSPSDVTASALPAAVARASKMLGFNSSGALTLSVPAEGSAAALALSLASNATHTVGAGQVAFGFGLTYGFDTVGGQLNDLRPFCPEQFGAPATWDGVSDDMTAFTQMVAAVNAAGGGHVHLRRTYYLAATGLPETVNVEFVDCDGLVIESRNGAKILRKGNFVHSVSQVSSKIVMRRCSRVLTLNLEIDGQVSTGTKVGDEQGEHGLEMFACKDVTHINPYFHDNPNDGIRADHEFSAGVISARAERLTVVNGRFPNNGRQGVSLIGYFGISFWNTDFVDTGKTGAFGFYSPSAGVDIEPNSATELCVSNVHFHGCKFTGNLGSAFVCVNQATVARPGIAESGNVNNVWLHGCEFASDAAATGTDQVILAVKNGGIIGGSTDFREFGGASSARMVLVYADCLSATQLRYHKITGKKQALLAAKDATRTVEQQRVTIDGCEFISADTATNGGAIFAQIDCGGQVTDNRFYMPAAAYSTGSATRETVRLFKLFRVLGNTYETDMSTVGQKFTVTYTGAESTTLERYKQPTFFGV